MIFDCDIVKRFWEQFQKEVVDRVVHSCNLKIDKELVLFGTKEKTVTDPVFDFLVLFAKFFLYKCKLQNVRPNFVNFQTVLKKRFQVEKYIAYVNCKSMQFEEQWLLYQPILL